MSEEYNFSHYNPNKKQGSMLVVMALSLLIALACSSFIYIPKNITLQFIMFVLSLFSIAGIFFLYAYFVGIVGFQSKKSDDDIIRSIVNFSKEGMLVTDSGLNLVFTNPAYVDVCECMLNMQVMAPHHLFSHIPDAAKPIYRLVQSARKGIAHAEDIRFSVPGLQADASRWFKIKVQPLHTTEENLYLWSVSDTTKEKSEV